MATINVFLPAALRAWVDEKIGKGSFFTASDYVRDLVRRDRDYQTKMAALRVEIQKGFDSGVSPRSPHEIIEDVIARGRARHAEMARD